MQPQADFRLRSLPPWAMLRCKGKRCTPQAKKTRLGATAKSFGRHYKIVDGTVTPSTKSCFVQPASPRAVAAVVTHLLSETPTEFHVFLSLAQDKPIYVMTSLGVWAVEKGKIRLVKQHEPVTGSSTVVDRPLELSEPELRKMEEATTPYVARAKESYPQARTRFLAGLPSGERFFIVTRVVGANGKSEQAFIRVKSILDGRVTGTIATDMRLLTSYKPGDPYDFPESDLIDWLIKKPDGSEAHGVRSIAASRRDLWVPGRGTRAIDETGCVGFVPTHPASRSGYWTPPENGTPPGRTAMIGQFEIIPLELIPPRLASAVPGTALTMLPASACVRTAS